MDAALAALIGAGVGAVVPSATSLIASIQARRDAREARLFDHRREGYAAFLSQARQIGDAATEWWDAEGYAPPEYVLDRLVNARAEVSLYGTPEADRLAGEVIKAMVTYTLKNGSAETHRSADLAIGAFVARARVDLGVTSK
ncbi:hypothetical protein [Nocardioides sp. TF02-7]|uniref:hypothetical protein n=1 Tax=Nocardioides sp. TF02-7 TaxID=2917724 RepID=UPI001F053DCF|nr:hypothetical protein [Nocardioides sp. TF02-7]UMG92832.1 hypothetical protein MF408_00075 [Nocardioides sp. TF02-7]